MGRYIERIEMLEYEGRNIFGIAYLPEIDGTCPIVIFSHGYNSENEAFKGYGEYLASHGIAAYCYDFCGGSANSKSNLKTTDMTIFTEKVDLEAVIKSVKQWDIVDKNNIFLFGASQGGLVTALTAEEHCEDIRGIILIYPAFCIADDWTNKYEDESVIPDEIDFWGMKLSSAYIKSVYKFDTMAHIGKFDKNVLIMHGDKDEVVSQEYSLEAVKHYKNAKIEIFHGEGHGFTQEGDDKAVKIALEFIKDNRIN